MSTDNDINYGNKYDLYRDQKGKVKNYNREYKLRP